MKSVSVFVDVQNIYYTARSAYGKNFDYNAFWAMLSSETDIQHAFAYAIDRGDEKQRQFQNILRAIGFNVRLKPFIQRADGTCKGDWDVGITIDIMEYAKSTDELVLLSGDGDFALLLHHMKNNYNVSTRVFGVPELTSPTLIGAADTFTPIDNQLLL